MGDVVTCTAVLYWHKPSAREYLLLSGRGHDYLCIPVRPKGTARTETPEWEYEYRGGKVLDIEPSLFCPDDPEPKFHTDFHWTVRFERLLPEDPREAFDVFNEINATPTTTETHA